MVANAKFYDGSISLPLQIQILQDINDLVVKDLNNQVLARYAFSDLILLETATDSLPGIFSVKSTPDVRLVVEDPLLFHQILSHMKHFQKRLPIDLSWLTLAILSILAVVALGSVFVLPQKFSPILARIIPEPWENAVGKIVREQMTKDMVFCSDPSGQKALDKLAHKLINTYQKSPSTLVLKVIHDDSINNAFAISGNQIFVFSGLIKNCQTDAELAGVLAHEIGHIVKRHPTERTIHGLGLILFFKLISGGINHLETLFTASNLYLTSKYSRIQEREADEIAIEILTKGGIGTKGLATFFESTQEKEEEQKKNNPEMIQKIEGFFSTHPVTKDRIDHIQERSSVKHTQQAMSPKEWSSIKKMCIKVKDGKAQDISKGQ